MRFWIPRLERRTFRKASAVVANVEAAASMWRRQFPWAQPKLHVIYNGFDPEDVPHARDLPARAHKLIVHAGALYHGRNPNVWLNRWRDCARQGRRRRRRRAFFCSAQPTRRPGSTKRCLSKHSSEGWLELRPQVPRAEAQRLLEEADALLLVQPQSNVQVPGKLFEYMCIGRPIVALVQRASAVEDILLKADARHVCIYTDDSAETADAKMLEFLRLPNTATAPNEWFQTSFNARQQTAELAKIIDGIG